MDFHDYLQALHLRVELAAPRHMLQACREEAGRVCTRYSKIPHLIDEHTLYVVGRGVWGGRHVDGWKREGTILRPLGDRPSRPRLRQLAAWLSITGMGREEAIRLVAGWVLWHIWLPPGTVTDESPAIRRTSNINPYI